jgi:GT2 family glycosyltransferase
VIASRQNNAADIAALIVTYNSAEHLNACLESLLQYDLHAVVVDNASADGSAALAEAIGAKVIRNQENRGFAAAMNQAASATESKYLLLVNPDIVLTANPSLLLKSLLEHSAAAATSDMRGVNGERQTTFHIRRLPTPWTLLFQSSGINALFPGNPVNRRYVDCSLEGPDPVWVEQPSGAFFLVSREWWDQLGGFDEEFFPLWFEDVDFCKRLKNAGGKIAFHSEAMVKHYGGHSVRGIGRAQRQLYWYGSLLRYACKHFASASTRLIAWVVFMRGLAESVVDSIRSFRSEAMRARIPQLKLALQVFVTGSLPASHDLRKLDQSEL